MLTPEPCATAFVFRIPNTVSVYKPSAIPRTFGRTSKLAIIRPDIVT